MSIKTLFLGFVAIALAVACCERGILYEKLPENVEKAINDFDKTARIIKFTDGGKYCIATGNGASIYNI